MITKFKSARLALQIVVLFVIVNTFHQSVALNVFKKLCNVKNFDDFLRQTGKSYSDPKEYEYRKSIFIGKKSVVDLTNKNAAEGTSSYHLSINQFADLTSAEIAKITGSRLSYSGEQITSKHTNFVTAKADTRDLPDSFDWREKGGVTPPSFQGDDCGSCWSFSAIGSLEGHVFRRTGVLIPLSSQNLIDCAQDYGTEGCDGGFQEYGFEYIRDRGVTLDVKYPYKQSESPRCENNGTDDSSLQIRDYARIKPGDEGKMKEVIAKLGPLACSINGSPISFQEYSGGVYDDNECNQDEVNHSIVVVGYGSENGKDYWIVKNSYSENWGENGFIRILRNAGSFCGIASECSYPIL